MLKAARRARTAAVSELFQLMTHQNHIVTSSATRAPNAKVLGVNYLLPPVRNGIEAEEMYLMIRPLGEVRYLSRASVVKYIRAIYSTIYQYHTNTLLERTLQKLPTRITLCTMRV